MSLKHFILSKQFLRHLGLAIAIFTAILLITLIWVNIYTRHGQSREVPVFIGRTLEEAKDIASKNKFRFVVTDSVYTSLVPRGTIAEQNPVAGHRVKKNRRINITINAFNPEMAAVPNLLGLSLRQALATITTAGFETGKLTYTPDISVDVVLRQLHNGVELMPGDTIQKGAVIDLLMGNGLSSRRTLVPNLIGMSLDQARNQILSSSLNLGTFVYDSTIMTGLDTLAAFVYKQNPEFVEDARAQIGSTVYIWLSVDSLKLPVDSTMIIINDSIGGIPGIFMTELPDFL
ncbi:MAG: PASTA domain-containing protein [Bacteroidales bacterium]|nr:PASTA domain-containing protein [Bacteroidales bacterium]